MFKIELSGLADGGIGVERVLDALPQGRDVHGGRCRGVVAVGGQVQRVAGGQRELNSGCGEQRGGRQARSTRAVRLEAAIGGFGARCGGAWSTVEPFFRCVWPPLACCEPFQQKKERLWWGSNLQVRNTKLDASALCTWLLHSSTPPACAQPAYVHRRHLHMCRLTSPLPSSPSCPLLPTAHAPGEAAGAEACAATAFAALGDAGTLLPAAAFPTPAR